MSNIQIRIVLGYKDVFGDEPPPLLELLKGYNPVKLIQLISNLNFQLKQKANDTTILSSYFQVDRFHPKYIRMFRVLSEKSNIIFNEKTNTLFFKSIFENYDYLTESNTEKNSLIEILIAYLKINETSFGDGRTDFSEIEMKYFEEYSQILFFSKLYDFERDNNITFQFLRIKSLLHYYYKNLPSILDQFHHNNRIENIDFWISELLLFIVNQGKNNLNLFNSDNKTLTNYFDTIAINQKLNKKLRYVDMKIFPIFNINDDYLILNWNYFFIGIYYNIDFQLFSLYRKINDISYADYKSIISKEVSERITFRYLITNLIKSKPSITKLVFDNEEKGFVDCYLRIGNRIFIIEFKDYIANSDFLHTYDLIKMQKQINEDFLRKKGVQQLANFINNFGKMNKDFDEKLKYTPLNSLEIVPIIVVTEEFYSTPTYENLFARNFLDRIDKLEFKKIGKLVACSLEELVRFISYNNQDDFFKLIFQYSKSKKAIVKPQSFKQFPDFRFVKNKHYKSKFILQITEDLMSSEVKLMDKKTDVYIRV